ncbi:hypothetical protein [Constantimarinum furrinae]|nr:hypothetical protein [Constantimarinum furrinae]
MKKRKLYLGELEGIPNRQILLNINFLDKGRYTLKITHNNKIIKQTTFRK